VYAALEPAVFTQGKSGSLFASMMTYGLVKAKWKAVVRNAQANVRTKNQKPTFYFRFESTSTNLGSSGGFAGMAAAATSLNEFVLVQMTTKKDARELIVGEVGAFHLRSNVNDLDPENCLDNGVPLIETSLRGQTGMFSPTMEAGSNACQLKL
jgi:hypothetical protein